MEFSSHFLLLLLVKEKYGGGRGGSIPVLFCFVLFGVGCWLVRLKGWIEEGGREKMKEVGGCLGFCIAGSSFHGFLGCAGESYRILS